MSVTNANFSAGPSQNEWLPQKGVPLRSFGGLTVLGFVVAVLIGGGMKRCWAATGIYGGTLDQSYLFSQSPSYRAYVIYSGILYAQTFRVGISGTLTEVDLQVQKAGPTLEQANAITEPLVLSIVSTAGGAPGSLTLGTVSIPASAVSTSSPSQNLVPVDLTPLNISLQSGQLLGIQLSSTVPAPAQPSDTTGYGFITLAQDGYAPGSAWFKMGTRAWASSFPENFDFGFQTFVQTVPEPGALGLLAIATALLVVPRRSTR